MTSSDLGSQVWINGEMIDSGQAVVPVTDRGFTLGDGLFETMLWTGSHVRFFEDHLTRLLHSANELGIEIPQKSQDILAALMALGADTQGSKAVFRLTLTRGSGPRGLAISEIAAPMLIVSIVPFQALAAPVSLSTVPITRHAGAPSALYKTLSYVDNIMALRQARLANADDAIMLGTTGNVACASSANIVINYQGASLTPAVEDGALPGIVRGRLIATGLVEVAQISPQMLDKCDDAVLTNAIIGVRQVSQINGRILPKLNKWAATLAKALTD